MKFTTLMEAMHNDPTVAASFAAGFDKVVLIVALANEKQELLERITELSMLCPSRVRMPDGSIKTYYPPEDLIPITEIPKESL